MKGGPQLRVFVRRAGDARPYELRAEVARAAAQERPRQHAEHPARAAAQKRRKRRQTTSHRRSRLHFWGRAGYVACPSVDQPEPAGHARDEVSTRTGRHYERKKGGGADQTSMRDRFLIAAPTRRGRRGSATKAERCGSGPARGNRHHQLRPYGSFEEASRAADGAVLPLEGDRANTAGAGQRHDSTPCAAGDEAAPPPRFLPPAPTHARFTTAPPAASYALDPARRRLCWTSTPKRNGSRGAGSDAAVRTMKSRVRPAGAGAFAARAAPAAPGRRGRCNRPPRPQTTAGQAAPLAAPPARYGLATAPLREIPLRRVGGEKRTERPPRPPARSCARRARRAGDPPQTGAGASVALTVRAARTAWRPRLWRWAAVVACGRGVE